MKKINILEEMNIKTLYFSKKNIVALEKDVIIKRVSRHTVYGEIIKNEEYIAA